MGTHDPCRPGQCARTLQPAEQRRAFQLQLQAWLQTPPPRSAWEVAGEIEEIDEEIASVTSGEVRCGAARSTWLGLRALELGLGFGLGLGRVRARDGC